MRRLLFVIVVAMVSAAACTPPPAPAPSPPANCHDDSTGANADILYLGQIGGFPQLPSYKNVQASASQDGTCSAPVNIHSTAVEAPDLTTANGYCNVALTGGVATNAVELGYTTMPDDVYLCLGVGLGDQLLENAGCYEGVDDNVFDLKFLGPRNSPNNAVLTGSVDGSCDTTATLPLTLVQHSSQTLAHLMCAEIGVLSAAPLNSGTNAGRYPDAPADIFACI